jgi:hypothetical protein
LYIVNTNPLGKKIQSKIDSFAENNYFIKSEVKLLKQIDELGDLKSEYENHIEEYNEKAEFSHEEVERIKEIIKMTTK